MATPFDPAADPIVSQTVQGVTANNLKTFGHYMDIIVQESAKDVLEEGRTSRSMSRQAAHALSARVVESILGREVEDAVTDAVEGNTGLDASQQGAAVAASTSNDALVTALAQINSQLQQAQSQNQQFLLQLMAFMAQNPVGTPTKP